MERIHGDNGFVCLKVLEVKRGFRNLFHVQESQKDKKIDICRHVFEGKHLTPGFGLYDAIEWRLWRSQRKGVGLLWQPSLLLSCIKYT